MIIDIHTHAFPPRVIERRQDLLATEPAFAGIYANPDARMATAEDVLASMDAAGVDRSVVCNFAWRSEVLVEATNDYLIEWGQRSSGRLLPFVSMYFPPDAGAHGRAEMEEAPAGAKRGVRERIRDLAAAGARGIGELRPDASGYNLGDSDEGDLLAWVAAAFDLTVLVHATEPVGHHYAGKQGGSIDAIAAFARNAAGVTIIAAHWGGGLPFYALMPEVGEALDPVYFDTAASHLLYDPAIYRRVIDLVGVEKIVWASDFPLTSQAKALERTRAADLSDAELAAILGNNAARLLNL
ncbi:MAG TPA: amidohydrolase family protein [Dehalococcoidia bacterium]|nr:amidohydrolase family protein [Dehalococcoidia bacterium]